MELIYCFLDIEIDGPTPGENSMLSLGFAAFDEDEREVGVFETNLETLEGACGAENVMRWWRMIRSGAITARQACKGAPWVIDATVLPKRVQDFPPAQKPHQENLCFQ